jgi:glycerophosphoryl diester phosphodiesterase
MPVPLGACAHRGDMKHFPENTLPAFASAVAKGAHMIEFDVYLTKAGVPVIIHDRTVDRTTDGKGNVTDFTFEELRNLDAGSWFDPKFVGTRIPTLQETLEVIPPYILCNVHLKNAPGLAATVARVLKQQDRIGNCFLACSIQQAREARNVAAGIKICNMSDRRVTLARYVDATRDAGAAFLQVHYKADGALAEQVKRAKELGITTNYFFADVPEEIRRVADAGVNYILTNDLDICLDVLKREYGVRPARKTIEE